MSVLNLKYQRFVLFPFFIVLDQSIGPHQTPTKTTRPPERFKKNYNKIIFIASNCHLYHYCFKLFIPCFALHSENYSFQRFNRKNINRIENYINRIINFLSKPANGQRYTYLFKSKNNIPFPCPLSIPPLLFFYLQTRKEGDNSGRERISGRAKKVASQR